MNDDKYTVAIEISSSKIMGVVTRTTRDGLLEVIAAEQEKGVETVRYGIIQNLDETSNRIARIIEKLERHPAVAPKTIAGAYIGLSGRSLRSITTEVSLNLPDDTEISNEILDRLRQRALNAAIDSSLEVVDAVARVYKIGKTETLSPKGVIGNSIKATFDLIVCRPEMRRNIRKTVAEKVGVEPRGFIVTALACGQLILSTEEKRLGCMLVDMGAETTTVTIYKNGHLCYFATLPLGGRNITRDLQSLNLLEEHAEEIKQVSGNATAGAVPGNLKLNGLKLSDVSNIIVARTEEILANVIEQIEYAGMKRSDLAAGIICTGGGFQLSGILDLLAQQSNMNVKRAQLPVYVHINNSIRMEAHELTQVVSVAYAGATLGQQECLEQNQAAEMPANGELPDTPVVDDTEPEEHTGRRSFGSKFMEKIGRKMNNFFGNTEDNSAPME